MNGLHTVEHGWNGAENRAGHTIQRSLERARISCTWLHPRTACAAFSKESRMKFANATMLHRRSGGPASSPVLESVAPLFGLPDGLYPNHRILFHQYKESPLQQNEAHGAPRVH